MSGACPSRVALLLLHLSLVHAVLFPQRYDEELARQELAQPRGTHEKSSHLPAVATLHLSRGRRLSTATAGWSGDLHTPTSSSDGVGLSSLAQTTRLDGIEKTGDLLIIPTLSLPPVIPHSNTRLRALPKRPDIQDTSLWLRSRMLALLVYIGLRCEREGGCGGARQDFGQTENAASSAGDGPSYRAHRPSIQPRWMIVLVMVTVLVMEGYGGCSMAVRVQSATALAPPGIHRGCAESCTRCECDWRAGPAVFTS